jgi:hypothetical protein
MSDERDANVVIDAPRYAFGFTIAGSCSAAAAIIIVVWKYIYLVTDKPEKKQQNGSGDAVMVV